MGTQGMNCLVRTIVRCYTSLKENTTYRKSITVSTQSGSWTQVYTRTITSTSPPRIFLYMDIISLNLILHIRVICRRLQSLGCGANYRGTGAEPGIFVWEAKCDANTFIKTTSTHMYIYIRALFYYIYTLFIW